MPPQIRLPRPSVLLLIAALGAAMGAAGCQGKPQRAACPSGKVCLEFGNNSEPQTLDPAKSNLVDEAQIISDLMQGLTTDAPDGQPIAAGAKSWETSPDGLRWTFHLRESKWSDGVPVTADDYVFGLRRTLDPKTASIYAYLLYVLKNGAAVNEGKLPLTALGVSAPDPLTLVIDLEHPAPYLLEIAKHQSFFPAPRHAVERYGDAWVQPGKYVSNGAFRLVGWRLGDRIVTEKNPQFWDVANVCIDRVNYYPTPDIISAERQIARGELDINTKFQSNRYERLKRTLPGVARTDVGLSTSYLSLNTRDYAAFKDIRVRRALSMALDREFIANKLLRAGQKPAYSFVPPTISNYVPQTPRLRWSAMSFPERQAEARRLLASAGYTKDRPLKIRILAASNTNTLLLMEAIQADWRAIGVVTGLDQAETGVAFASYRNRAFQIGSMSWVADFNDPVTFLGLLKSDTGAQNYGDYKNPAYDALLERADREPDVAKRAQILAQAEQRMLDDEGILPLLFDVNRNLVSPRVTGWQLNSPNFHRTRWMCLKK